MKDLLIISLFGTLFLMIGTLIGLLNFGYAQNDARIGSNMVDIRLQNLTEWPNIHSNVKTDFNPNVTYPQIQTSALFTLLQ